MIEVRTKQDIAAQKKLSRFEIKKSILSPVNLILYSVILLCGILFCILSFLSEQENDFLFYGILLIVLAVALPFLAVWISVSITKAATKTNKQLLAACDTYVRFDEESFYCENTRSDAVISSGTTQYAHLFKVFETETDFFLYIHKTAAFIIPKSDFTVGSPQQLRMLLQNRLGTKYKIKGKF